MPPSPQQQAANLRRGVPILAGYLALYFGVGYGFPWLTGEPLIKYTFRSLGLLGGSSSSGSGSGSGVGGGGGGGSDDGRGVDRARLVAGRPTNEGDGAAPR